MANPFILLDVVEVSQCISKCVSLVKDYFKNKNDRPLAIIYIADTPESLIYYERFLKMFQVQCKHYAFCFWDPIRTGNIMPYELYDEHILLMTRVADSRNILERTRQGLFNYWKFDPSRIHTCSFYHYLEIKNIAVDISVVRLPRIKICENFILDQSKKCIGSYIYAEPYIPNIITSLDEIIFANTNIRQEFLKEIRNFLKENF